MVEDLRRDHQLVRAGALDERRDRLLDRRRARRSPSRTGPGRASPAPAAAASRHSRHGAAAAASGWPVRRLTKACISDVASNCASSSRVGGEGVEAEHHVGPVELRRGLEALAIDLRSRPSSAPARNGRRRRRGGRASPRAARRTGSSRGSTSGCRGPRREWRGRAGPPRALEIIHQLDDVARELVLVRAEVAAQRAAPPPVGARRAAEAEVDPPREERFERSELLGDGQRRMVGQHDPARADADASRCRRRHKRAPPPSRRWRCPASNDARPSRSGDSPAVRHAGQGRAHCEAPGRHRCLRRWGRDRGWRKESCQGDGEAGPG